MSREEEPGFPPAVKAKVDAFVSRANAGFAMPQGLRGGIAWMSPGNYPAGRHLFILEILRAGEVQLVPLFDFYDGWIDEFHQPDNEGGLLDRLTLAAAEAATRPQIAEFDANQGYSSPSA